MNASGLIPSSASIIVKALEMTTQIERLAVVQDISLILKGELVEMEI